MPTLRWLDLTWEEIAALDGATTVALLPIGAVEAHGPHLPLGTDGIIAEAMVADAAGKLEAYGLGAVVLPTLDYTNASFAAAFAGTASMTPESVRATVGGVGRAVARAEIACLALANAHLDPVHLGSLRAALEDLDDARLALAFPDVTRKPWALRLGDEFRSGACHAGRYESSIVMAARPDLVRDSIRRELDPNPSSLSVAMREGKTSFAAAGGARAYFGYPAEASAEEGGEHIDALGTILVESILEAVPQAGAKPESR